MYLEPIGTSAVAGPSLRHSDCDAFLQPAGFAGRTVLFVDDASAAVLAWGDGTNVVVRSAKE